MSAMPVPSPAIGVAPISAPLNWGVLHHTTDRQKIPSRHGLSSTRIDRPGRNSGARPSIFGVVRRKILFIRPPSYATPRNGSLADVDPPRPLCVVHGHKIGG